MSESRRAAAWSHRPALAPADFPRTPWGHRGYDEECVDAFVEQVAKDRAAAEDQISDLRDEVDRLHLYIRRQWAAVAAAESGAGDGAEPGDQAASPVFGPASGGRQAVASRRDHAGTIDTISPAAQARAVLGQAQEIADRRLAQADARLTEAERLAEDRLAHAERQAQLRLAEAERQTSRLLADSDEAAARRLHQVDEMAEQVLVEARQDAGRRRAAAQEDSTRLLLLARNRYEDIVVRAHQRADRAAEVALEEYRDPGTPDLDGDGGRLRAELEVKAAYLRTFAKVSRAALQAALDVTAREFDRLLGATASAEQDAGVRAQLEPAQLEPAQVQPAQLGPAQQEPARRGDAGAIPSGPIAIAPGLMLDPTRSRRRSHPARQIIVLPDTDEARLAGVTTQH